MTRLIHEIDSDIARYERYERNAKCNHILHLLLSVFTMGIWVIVWLITSLNTASQRKSYEHTLRCLYSERGQALIDSTQSKEG